MAELGQAPAGEEAHQRRLDALQHRLGYRFADVDLLLRALTHKSASARRNNERLEYLGDAVLGYVIAAHLHQDLAAAPESVLTLRRAALVKQATLAEVARSLDLGAHLALGVGEMRSGGGRRASIVADALEAVVGAVHEDGGIEAARALALRLLADRLAGSAVAKDAKTALQEFAQARAVDLPEYRIVEQVGPRHRPCFTICCEVAQLGLKAQARGASRKEAEMQAAAAVLSQVEADDERG